MDLQIQPWLSDATDRAARSRNPDADVAKAAKAVVEINHEFARFLTEKYNPAEQRWRDEPTAKACQAFRRVQVKESGFHLKEERLVKALAKTKATTLAGLTIKARVMELTDTEWQVLEASIVRDLLAIADARAAL